MISWFPFSPLNSQPIHQCQLICFIRTCLNSVRNFIPIYAVFTLLCALLVAFLVKFRVLTRRIESCAAFGEQAHFPIMYASGNGRFWMTIVTNYQRFSMSFKFLGGLVIGGLLNSRIISLATLHSNIQNNRCTHGTDLNSCTVGPLCVPDNDSGTSNHCLSLDAPAVSEFNVNIHIPLI